MTEEAINRFKRNAEARANAERKRAHANFRSIVFGLLALVAITYWFAYKDVIDWQHFDIGTVVSSLRERWVGGDSKPTVQVSKRHLDDYIAIVGAFSKGELAHWKEVPESLNPKNAPAGTVYHALVPRAQGFELFELHAGGFCAEITPFREPVPMAFADFRKVCNGKPFFIACAGRVYVCGGGNLQQMSVLRKGLLPR